MISVMYIKRKKDWSRDNAKRWKCYKYSIDSDVHSCLFLSLDGTIERWNTTRPVEWMYLVQFFIQSIVLGDLHFLTSCRKKNIKLVFTECDKQWLYILNQMECVLNIQKHYPQNEHNTKNNTNYLKKYTRKTYTNLPMKMIRTQKGIYIMY